MWVLILRRVAAMGFSILFLTALIFVLMQAVFGDPVVTRRILTRLPKVEVKTLDSRHWIPTENPVEMREAIESFLTPAPGRDAC